MLIVARDITIDRGASTIFQLNIGLYCNQVKGSSWDSLSILVERTPHNSCAYYCQLVIAVVEYK